MTLELGDFVFVLELLVDVLRELQLHDVNGRVQVLGFFFLDYQFRVEVVDDRFLGLNDAQLL